MQSVLFRFCLSPLQVRGVVCWAFADFGKRFEITDATGEEPIAISIASISNVCYLLP